MRSLHLSVCVLNFCAPSPRIWIEFGLRIWIPTFGFPKHVECMCWVGICKSMFLCFYVFLSCHYDFLSGNLPVPKIIIIGFFGLWGLWFYDFTIFFYVNGQALVCQGFVCVCLNFSLRAINLHDLYFFNNGLKMDVQI